MSEDMYSVQQVADLLGLHVRTVRGYIRSGRLRAVRIGKQYRIAHADLGALTGAPTSARHATVDASSIVQIEGIDRAGADRLGTLVLAAAQSHSGAAPPLRVQTVHDERRHRMRIVILGGLADTAELLHLLAAVVDDGNDLVGGGAEDA